MADHDEHDPDRAAILARRRRFVALALGGLATGCTPGRPNSEVTGDSAGESTSGESSSGGESSSSGVESDTAPRPCLKFDLPPEPETDTDTESGGESESGSGDTGTETGATTGPRPCLVPPRN